MPGVKGRGWRWADWEILVSRGCQRARAMGKRLGSASSWGSRFWWETGIASYSLVLATGQVNIGYDCMVVFYCTDSRA